MLVTSIYGALKSDLSCFFFFFFSLRESRYSHDCETFSGLVYHTVERAILVVFVFSFFHRYRLFTILYLNEKTIMRRKGLTMTSVNGRTGNGLIKKLAS